MQRRYWFAALGVMLLAAAIALPVFAQGRGPGPGQGPGIGPGGCAGMGFGFGPTATAAGPVNIDTAVSRVKEALTAAGYTDLAPKEIMEFSNHFYVLVTEMSTGLGAMELIVERNGWVHPEPGPNMMWNTKYGHAGPGAMGMMGMGPGYGPGASAIGPGYGPGPGMMGPGYGPGGMMGPGRGPRGTVGQPQGQALTREQARDRARQWLNAAIPGTAPDDGTTAFYGYFTFDVEREGKTTGMLSVNAYTGQVWYHTWHGAFVRERDLQ